MKMIDLSHLAHAGFTARQADAIAYHVENATAVAVDGIRSDIWRGHVYLGLYLLVLLGIVLLAVLMLETTLVNFSHGSIPPSRAMERMGGAADHSPLQSSSDLGVDEPQ